MKKFIPIIILLIAVYMGWSQSNRSNDSVDKTDQNNVALSTWLDERRSGVQTQGKGIVIKVLPDDNQGSRHQRFILKLHSGQTLLIAHNIDLAPRLSNLRKGDTVAFNGEYEWNKKGGVIHWTHHDPRGRHEPGWLKYNGRTYQ
jgi:hypothetical protein